MGEKRREIMGDHRIGENKQGRKVELLRAGFMSMLLRASPPGDVE